jgi:peptide/nickel transport system substrate-binding protein
MKLGRLLPAVLLIAALSAPAATLRVASQGDVQSMDPHSLLEVLQLSFMGNVYEPLIGRDKHMDLVPLLATGWSQVPPST